MLAGWKLRNHVPMWSTLEYDRFDGRVILRSFQSRFSSILDSRYDRKRNDYWEIPHGTSRVETIPTRSVFSVALFHYVKKVEPFWKRLKESQAEIEVKGICLKRAGTGEYLGTRVNRMTFYRGGNPGSSGFGFSDVAPDSNFNGPLLADKVGTLKKNSRLRLNQDFYFVQVYDQFRVYTVDDMPWSIRNLMKGPVEKIFEKEAGEELPMKKILAELAAKETNKE